MGLYSTFQFLGAFAGGVVGGTLLAWQGSEVALWVAAGSCLVWGGILYGTNRRNFPTGRTT